MTDAIVAWLGTAGLPTDDMPGVLRVAMGVAGLVLLGRGAALARHGVRLAAAVSGALAALVVLRGGEAPLLPMVPPVVGGVAAIGAALCLWVELVGFRLALGATGLVAGAAVGAAVRDVLPTSAPAGWTPLVVGVSLALVLPWFFETVPKVFSPLVGAVALAWAVGMPASLPLLAAAWGLGATLQMFTGPEVVFLDEDDHARRSALR